MNSLDIAILLIMAVSITVSSVRGGIREIFSLAAVIVGFILAAHFYHMASASFIRPTSHPEVNDTISFVSIFLFAAILISFIGGSLTHMAKKSKSLSPWNAIFGTAVGALKGLVISTLIVYVLLVFLSANNEVLTGSVALPYLTRTARLVSPVAPRFFREEFDRKMREMKDKRPEPQLEIGTPGQKPSLKAPQEKHHKPGESAHGI